MIIFIIFIITTAPDRTCNVRPQISNRSETEWAAELCFWEISWACDDDDGGDDDDDDDGDGDDDDCGSCYKKINKVDQMRRELYTGAERLRFPEPH